MLTERQRPLASLVHSYDSSDDDELSTSEHITTSAASSSSFGAFDTIRPNATPTSPPVSLDRQVQQFVRDVSGLVSQVEEDEARQWQLIEGQSTRLYSHIDPATGRPYYFDSTSQLCVWQQPAVGDIEQWTDDTTPAVVADPQRLSSPPFDLPTSRAGVDRLVHDISLLSDRLTAAVEEQSETRRVSAALLQLELRIRRDDWEASAISDHYAAQRLLDLKSRLETELATAESQPSPAQLVSSQTVNVTGAKETAEAAATSSELQAGQTLLQPQANNTTDTESASVSTAAPPGVRRRSAVVSKPPSNPAAVPAPPSVISSPAPVQPPAMSPSPILSSYNQTPSAASGSKRRLEENKGAVGAMVQRWKAVRREVEDEGNKVEQQRQRQQEKRIELAEAEVRSSGSAANNPNLIAVSDHWRVRVQEKQQQLDQ